MAAADVEHRADRDRIPAQQPQYRRRVAEPAMHGVQLPVGLQNHMFRHAGVVENFGIDTAAEAHRLTIHKFLPMLMSTAKCIAMQTDNATSPRDCPPPRGGVTWIFL